MSLIPQAIFIIILGIFGFILFRRFSLIAKLIGLGKESPNKVDPSKAFKRMMLFAFGQKQMFDKPVLGILHFFIYAGFILINIEVLEIILDGILGTHRLFAPHLGSLYTFLISFFELMAILVFIACLVFLFRRLFVNVPRFRSAEMTRWPKLDANLILIIEILLVSAILLLDAADQNLQERGVEGYTETGSFFFSAGLSFIFDSFSDRSVLMMERSLWWFHILGIFGFAVYVSYSKHLHIFLAFPNTYYAENDPEGKMNNMPDITREVELMMGMQASSEGDPPESFGAKDVDQLSRLSLLGAFACTECGRCTEQCPANQTGKKLSPRKIMMSTRDRMEDLGKSKNFDKGDKTLVRDYISEEEILACTSCQACVEACPVQINPLEIIFELRRYLVMEESKTPTEWTSMMTNIENNAAPWAFPAAERFSWANELKNTEE